MGKRADTDMSHAKFSFFSSFSYQQAAFFLISPHDPTVTVRARRFDACFHLAGVFLPRLYK